MKVVPVGLSKGVKKLVQGKVPNLGRYDDVAEFLSRDANLSESEVEDDNEASRVTLPQVVSSRGNLTSQQERLSFQCFCCFVTLWRSGVIIPIFAGIGIGIGIGIHLDSKSGFGSSPGTITPL